MLNNLEGTIPCFVCPALNPSPPPLVLIYFGNKGDCVFILVSGAYCRLGWVKLKVRDPCSG